MRNIHFFTKKINSKIPRRVVFTTILLFLLILFSGVLFLSAQEKLSWEQPFAKCWDFPLANGANQQLASDNDSIITTTKDGFLLSINSENGQENWKTNFGGSFNSRLTIDRDNLFFISVLDNNISKDISVVRSVTVLTGLTNWQNILPFQNVSNRNLITRENIDQNIKYR